MLNTKLKRNKGGSDEATRRAGESFPRARREYPRSAAASQQHHRGGQGKMICYIRYTDVLRGLLHVFVLLPQLR